MKWSLEFQTKDEALHHFYLVPQLRRAFCCSLEALKNISGFGRRMTVARSCTLHILGCKAYNFRYINSMSSWELTPQLEFEERTGSTMVFEDLDLSELTGLKPVQELWLPYGEELNQNFSGETCWTVSTKMCSTCFPRSSAALLNLVLESGHIWPWCNSDIYDLWLSFSCFETCWSLTLSTMAASGSLWNQCLPVEMKTALTWIFEVMFFGNYD